MNFAQFYYRPKWWVESTAKRLIWKFTPEKVLKRRERGVWAETLLHRPGRHAYFEKKFGRWFEVFETAWTWYVLDGYKWNSPAYSQIMNWFLNDLFDMAVVAQLNDDNLLRNLFKRESMVGGPMKIGVDPGYPFEGAVRKSKTKNRPGKK